jgi:hypothetical protein
MVRVKTIVLISAFVAFCALAVGVLSDGAAAQPAVEVQEVREVQEPVQEPDQAQAPAPSQKDVYAVKFLCGSILPPSTSPNPTNGAPEGPVKPGNYLTAINVHNPNGNTIAFLKKAVLLYQADKLTEPEMPMPPSQLREAVLKPDWGLEIDCADIRNVLLKGSAPPAHIFIKGWVVIEVKGYQAHQVDPLPLDVTAVYTSHGYVKSGGAVIPEGFAEDVEPVLPKRVK